MNKVKSAERTLRLLELIATNPKGLTFSDIQDKLGLPKSSAFNLIQELMYNKYLIYNEDLRKYFAGMGFLRMCANCIGNTDVITEINLCVHHLCQELKETTHAGIIDGRFIIYISKAEAETSISLINQIGMRIPAHCTAIGKMLLSKYTDQEVREIYKDVELEKMTENTISNVEDLITELHKIQNQDYAIEMQEASVFASCISMPIYQDDSMIAAFSVTLPNYKFSEEYKNELIEKLKEAKKEIESRIRINSK